MKSAVRGSWLALGLMLLGWPLVGAADALEWLQRMNEAVRLTTYQGTAVYRNGEQLETLRVYHRFNQGREHERMYSLSGQQREVLRAGEQVTCILPDQKAVIRDHEGLRGLLPKLSRAAFEELGQVYELIQVVGDTRVAGRACREVRVRSRDIYRYNYALCLDEESALPLDIRLIDDNGALLEQVVFTHIEFPPHIDDSLFQSPIDTAGFRQVSQQGLGGLSAQSQSAEGVWEVRDLPEGFRLATRETGRWPGFEGPVTQMVYTDGLAAVSVFATSSQLPDETLHGLTRLGGVNAYGRMVDDHHVTVVGEVPQATVRFFGDNLRFTSPTSAP